ncbi:hypothetical protein M3672_11535 [Microbacterium enclense]|nr:hypothetical protein [Microbacterium enclense]
MADPVVGQSTTRPFECGGGHALAQPRVIEEQSGRGDEALVGAADEPGHPVVDGVAVADDVGHHGGESLRLRLDERERHALPQGREEEDVETVDQCRQLVGGHPTGHPDRRVGEPPRFVGGVAAADPQEVGAVVERPSGGREPPRGLLVGDATDHPDDGAPHAVRATRASSDRLGGHPGLQQVRARRSEHGLRHGVLRGRGEDQGGVASQAALDGPERGARAPRQIETEEREAVRRIEDRARVAPPAQSPPDRGAREAGVRVDDIDRVVAPDCTAQRPQVAQAPAGRHAVERDAGVESCAQRLVGGGLGARGEHHPHIGTGFGLPAGDAVDDAEDAAAHRFGHMQDAHHVVVISIQVRAMPSVRVRS